MTARRRDALVVAAVALVARLAVLVWAGPRIPAAADGTYYHTLAQRIAEGHGYTWRWPDGVVTYAAHYPVGYPALLGLGYAAFGAHPVVAMAINAALGVLASVAVWSLVTRPRLALAAGIACALHPALLPYTAAVMTEGPTASLLVIAAMLAQRARSLRGLVPLGLVFGVATLLRPQCLALAPVFGWLALPSRRWLGAGTALALALAVCAPWTARNCLRMEQCALVSVNGGWNLAIGAQTESGAWQEIVVPDACKEVFQEAAKDACFGREARRAIGRAPWAWMRRMPAKLRATFDYFGAAPWYLHAANPAAFPWNAKVALGAVETLVCRLLLAAALVAVLRSGRRIEGPRVLALRALCAVGLVACVLVPGTVAYLALAAALLLLPPGPLLFRATAAVILVTAATHAVFFGAGRYGLVVLPFVTAVAFGYLRGRGGEAMLRPVDADQAIAGPAALGHAGREESPSSTEHDAG